MNDLQPDLWIVNYGDYMYNYARQRVADDATAEDLLQETLLSAWKARDRFEGRSSEKTWLLSILKNKIIDHYRKTLTKGEEESGRKEVPMSFFSDDGSWQSGFKSTNWDSTATAQIESKEFFEVFQKCLDALKGKGHTAFTMKYIDEAESDEICKELDISPSNFWVLIHRAKLQLRNCLDTNWFNQL